MKVDLDILLVANRLVEERGSDAARLSRARLVEFIAANNQRAAAFWRDVCTETERILSEARAGSKPVAKTAKGWHRSSDTRTPA